MNVIRLEIESVHCEELECVPLLLCCNAGTSRGQREIPSIYSLFFSEVILCHIQYSPSPLNTAVCLHPTPRIDIFPHGSDLRPPPPPPPPPQHAPDIEHQTSSPASTRREDTHRFSVLFKVWIRQYEQFKNRKHCNIKTRKIFRLHVEAISTLRVKLQGE